MEGKQTWLVIFLILVIVALGIILISNSNNSPTIQGNVIGENQQPVTVLQNTQNTQPPIGEEKSISPTDLISFAQRSIQNNVPESKGAFEQSQNIDDAKREGNGCFTGFSYPCTSWFYPYKGAITDEVYAHIYDFGEKGSPSLNRILGDQSSFPGIERRSLSKGDIIVQEYDNENKNDYTGETVSYSRLFEVDIPCGDRYWVKVGFYQTDNYSSGKIEEKGAILGIASEVYDYCN